MIINQIETERLVIRNFTSDDVNDLYDILGDTETMKNCEPTYDIENTKDYLDNFCIGRNGAVAAVHKQSQKVIGYILFNEIDPSVYEIGWFFNQSYWRQGYVYEDCKAVIDYAFHDLTVQKVFAETNNSVKLVRLLQKLGMKLETVQRIRTKDNDEKTADLYLYEFLATDWRIHHDYA